MKHIKYLFFLTIIFCITLTTVNASSAYCAYSNGSTTGIGITIDENYKITYVNLSSVPGNVAISGVDFTLSNFLDANKNLYCPDVIYYKVTSSSGRTVNQAFSFDSSYGSQISLSTSTINNDSNSENPEGNEDPSNTNKTLLRECQYGSYTIYYFSDGTYTASGTGSMSNYTISFKPNNPEVLASYCPNAAYVVSSNGRGGNYASISFSPGTGLSKVELTNGYSQAEFNNDNNIVSPELAIDDIKFCDSNGVLKSFQIIGYLLYVAKLVIPLLLIILGSIDFAKATISSSDKAPQEALISLAKRVILGIIIFIIPTVLDFLLGLVDGASDAFSNSKVTKCTSCLLDPLGDCQAEDIDES